MTKEEVAYRLQAMATMCIFKDACGHDLSREEIIKYNEAKDIAIMSIKAWDKLYKEIEQEIIDSGVYSEIMAYEDCLDKIKKYVKELGVDLEALRD